MSGIYEYTGSSSQMAEEFAQRPDSESYELPPSNEQQILDLSTLPSEGVGELREKWQEIAQRAFNTTINPHDQQALAITTGIVEWRLFGEPGDPLPFGLVHKDTEEGARLVYDTRLGFGRHCVRAAVEKLDQAGSGEINAAVEQRIEEGSGQLGEIFKRSIEESSAFRFIQALAEGGLPQQGEDQQLSPFWRMIRETQATQMVKGRWGIESHKAILPRTPPDFELRRELLRLDDETMPSPSKYADEPLSRLRTYLEKFVREATHEKCEGEAITGFGIDEDGDELIRTAQNPTGYYGRERQDIIQDAAHKLAFQINEVAPHVQIMTEEYIYYLIDGIFWPQEGCNDFARLSNYAIDEAGWLQSYILFCRDFLHSTNNYAGYSNRGRVDARIHASLVRPCGDIVDSSELVEDTSAHHEHFCNARPSAEINNVPADRPVGDVMRFSSYAKGTHAHRIIQAQSSRQPLPPLVGNEELSLRLVGKKFDDAHPYIPGYRLVSKSKDIFGFIPDERGDPYASADIQLSSMQRGMLVAKYAELGLVRLSREVERSAQLTVQGLTSLIQTHSTYPSHTQKAQPPLSSSVNLEKLQDFRELIRDGSLHVQCSGAGQFLRFSLEEIFGKGSAATTTGYKLARRAISTTAWHAQTVFTYEGGERTCLTPLRRSQTAGRVTTTISSAARLVSGDTSDAPPLC